MIPKLVFNKHTKAKEYTKEEILREKVDELLKKNEEIKQELEELKNMIKVLIFDFFRRSDYIKVETTNL